MLSENSKDSRIDPCVTPLLINCVEEMSSPICVHIVIDYLNNFLTNLQNFLPSQISAFF